MLRLGTRQYLALRARNAQLLTENLQLRKQLLTLQQQVPESVPEFKTNLSASSHAYGLLLAGIVQSSYIHTHNFLTLDKGSVDGLRPNMGLLGPEGIVGRIKYVSRHFSTAYSLLDTDLLTSAQLGKNGVLCSVSWAAQGPRQAQLKYVPRHEKPMLGDTVYTSGYDNIYPPMLPIGIVEEARIEADETFYRIQLRLLTDFQALHHVYALVLPLKEERDSVQQHMQMP